MAMTRFRWAAVACTAAVFGGAVYVRAQVTTTDAPSLAAIASELRLLRQAVEKSTDTQTQIQALTAALSAQQSRLLQVSARAESLRKDVDAATAEHAVVTDYMTRLTNQMASGELSAEARDQALRAQGRPWSRAEGRGERESGADRLDRRRVSRTGRSGSLERLDEPARSDGQALGARSRRALAVRVLPAAADQELAQPCGVLERRRLQVVARDGAILSVDERPHFEE